VSGFFPLGANALSPVFQGLLDAIGWVLAFLYRYVPNYGVAIILLTLGTRILLLPLLRKQIRSTQAMQALQPKIKELQKKYKGNRQKLNEEMMKLYQEYGYNPLSGCFPLLAQFPVLIALFAVLSFPRGLTHIPHSDPNPVVGQPQDSRLYVDIVNQHTNFLGMNLVCSAKEAGTQVALPADTLQKFADLKAGPDKLDCGNGFPVRIPYYVLLVLMIGTTYYQQRQMQRASPAGASQQQQQMLTRIMPLFFGFIGFSFPVGLVLYWTTTNGVQIVQQHFMMGRRAAEGAEPSPKAKPAGDGARRGLMGRLADMQRAQPGQEKTPSDTPRQGLRGSGPGAQQARGGTPGRRRGQPLVRGGGASEGTSGRSAGQAEGQGGGKPQGSQGGARNARNRKKRRKR
jgi:YidC/Oxa1 family membrane protein insertase